VVVVVVVVGVVVGAPRTTLVGSDVATVEPFLLVAVIVTRSVELTSAERGTYPWAVAAPIAEHADPPLLQRCHW